MNINELASHVLRGNDDAREILFTQILLLTKQLALRYTRASHADDLSMDMIEDILVHMEEWDEKEAGFLTWMNLRCRTVAQAFAIREARNFETEEDALEPDQVPSDGGPEHLRGPVDLSLTQEDVSEVYSSMMQLEGRDRVAFMWYYVDECGYGTISRRLHTTYSNARQVVCRARDRFMKIWESRNGN